MLQFQCLAVLLSLILIAFFLQIIIHDYDYMVMRDGHRYVYPTFNSKHTSCDHSPSTCGGNDINLKCPFQFRSDHPNLCPTEFSRENNRTVLPVIGGNHLEERYNFSVDLNSIDYEQQTLRIFDLGVPKNNCSTLPVYSFKPNDDFYQKQVGASTIMYIDPDVDSLVFVSCKNLVGSKYSPLYVDTASCNITANQFSKMKAPSNYYSYVVVGKNVVASEIEESCTVYKTAPVDLRCLPNVTAGDISFQDIHNLLSNGLELSWFREWRSRRGFPCEYTDLMIY